MKGRNQPRTKNEWRGKKKGSQVYSVERICPEYEADLGVRRGTGKTGYSGARVEKNKKDVGRAGAGGEEGLNKHTKAPCVNIRGKRGAKER